MNNKAQLYYKWLYIALISGVVILSLAVVVLYLSIQQRNRVGVEQFGVGIEAFATQGLVGQESNLSSELFEADMILLVDPTDLTGFEYTYLTPKCAEKIKAIVEKSSSELLAFWLVDSCRIIDYYEVESDMDFRLIQNYFTGVNRVHFVLEKVNKDGKQIITIK